LTGASKIAGAISGVANKAAVPLAIIGSVGYAGKAEAWLGEKTGLMSAKTAEGWSHASGEYTETFNAPVGALMEMANGASWKQAVSDPLHKLGQGMDIAKESGNDNFLAYISAHHELSDLVDQRAELGYMDQRLALSKRLATPLFWASSDASWTKAKTVINGPGSAERKQQAINNLKKGMANPPTTIEGLLERRATDYEALLKREDDYLTEWRNKGGDVTSKKYDKARDFYRAQEKKLNEYWTVARKAADKKPAWSGRKETWGDIFAIGETIDHSSPDLMSTMKMEGTQALITTLQGYEKANFAYKDHNTQIPGEVWKQWTEAGMAMPYWTTAMELINAMQGTDTTQSKFMGSQDDYTKDRGSTGREAIVDYSFDETMRTLLNEDEATEAAKKIKLREQLVTANPADYMPSMKRHFGGPLPPSDFIMRAGEFQSGREIYTQDHLANMGRQMADLRNALDSKDQGFDPMKVDAQQFMDSGPGGGKTTGEIAHSGEIKLGLNMDAAALLRQIAALLQEKSGGAKVRAGDRIPSELSG
jgi:hypothetical protein